MKISLACDHGGLELKNKIKEHLEARGCATVDFGTFSTVSCDYPDFARPAAQAVASGECDRGILVCTTGIGMSMTANHIPGIRAALCGCEFQARATRQHNNANVLCLGGRVIDAAKAVELARIFLATPSEGGRHAKRVAMLEE